MRIQIKVKKNQNLKLRFLIHILQVLIYCKNQGNYFGVKSFLLTFAADLR